MSSLEAFLVVAQTMNRLKTQRAILGYAVFGAMAVMRYTEPFFTQDLDVLVVVKPQPLILLTPTYAEFQRMGYQWEGEHLVVEGFPVQLMVADELEAEAVFKARTTSVRGVRVRVLTPEYLIALLTRAGRPKDMPKLALLLSQTKYNQEELKGILTRFSLKEKFEWIVKRFGT